MTITHQGGMGRPHYILHILVLTAIIFGNCIDAVPRSTVTLDDIRDAILQVVNVVRATDDKLERHEFRERLAGDNLKKGLISIDKRIKMLEPFKGTISRLDQRLAAVETILMQNLGRVQLEKTHQLVEDIHNKLPAIVEKITSEIIESVGKKLEEQQKQSKDDKTKDDQVAKKLDKVQSELERKLGDVGKSVANLTANVESLKKSNEKTRDAELKKQLNSTEELLEKYETKLAEYNNRIVPTPEPLPAQRGQHLIAVGDNQEDIERNIFQVLDQQKVDLDKIVQMLANSTEHVNKLDKQIEMGDTKTEQSLSNMSKAIDLLGDKFGKNYTGLKSEIENLAKVEQVMVQTADVVLDTRRRVEYGTHQIINEMKEVIKKNSKDVDQAIADRFDTFEMSILDEDNGALANLTSKIGQEIDQVWRQIGIMHQQMTMSTDTLNKLQNQTDVYVNGSQNVLDNMKGNVVKISKRIVEVDENLNYLLGKLSLVTQEFNQIKGGIGKALDEMKDTYKVVKDKVKQTNSVDDRPHKIQLPDEH